MVGMAESVTVFHIERVLRLVNQGPVFDSTVLPGPWTELENIDFPQGPRDRLAWDS